MKNKLIATLGATAALATLFVSTPVARATASTTLNVVTLGDSYASGVGAASYYPDTVGKCWRSPNSYSERIVAGLRIHSVRVNFSNVSCGGATIRDLRQPYNGVVQVDALRFNTDVVFLTVGGNDIGFGDTVKQCLAADCSGAPIDLAISKLDRMSWNLAGLILEIKLRSPHARIVLAGYGQPLSRSANPSGVSVDPICAPEYFSLAEREAGSRLSAKLNHALQEAADRSNWLGRRTTLVSPYVNDNPDAPQLQLVFQGRSLCEASVFTQSYRGFDALPPSPVADPAEQDAIVHLNSQGHEVLAKLIQAKVPALTG